MSNISIPFSPPDIRQCDIDAVAAVLRSGWITTGPVTKQFEKDVDIATLKDAKLTFIPYYAWANRGENEMQVWIRE